MSEYKRKNTAGRRFLNAVSNRLVIGIALLIFGLGMIFCPAAYINTVVMIIGVLMLLACAVRVVFFIKGVKNFTAIISLVITALFAVFAVFCIASPAWVVSFSYIIFGIVILLDGAGGIYNAVGVLRAGGSLWVPFLILSIVTVILGAAVIFNPFGAADLSVRFIGIILSLGGVFDICHALAKDREADA